MIILSGDIGGTNTRLQLAEIAGAGHLKSIYSARYANVDYQSLSEIIDVFLSATDITKEKVDSVCFGVAGPLVDGEVKFTNLPWIVKTDDLKDEFAIEQVALLNDFVAIGYALETLTSEDLLTLQSGDYSQNGVKAYIGAGTGLGIGFMTWSTDSYMIHPTEGGHVDFAPVNDLQIELLRFLQKKHQRVSVERVLSGRGLINIYLFLRGKHGSKNERAELKKIIDSDQNPHLAKEISKYALEYDDALAKQALEIFISIYGAVAGDLALTTLPYGGMYIVASMAAKILPQTGTDIFLKSFINKGRLSSLMQNIPLHLVLDPNIGLRGATIYASKLIGKY